MIQALLSGIYWGLFLAILVGPVLFILIQAGIEQGFRAGVTLALGMWISDLLLILGCFLALSLLVSITSWPGFEPALGLIGGSLLILLGLVTLSRRPAGISIVNDTPAGISSNYLALGVKGFLLNTLNPFAFVFWIIINTTIIGEQHQDGRAAFWFFAGIMGTIIITDCTKILLARGLRRWLTPAHLLLVRRISGGMCVLFGLAMILRSSLI